MCYILISLVKRHYLEFEIKKGNKPKEIPKSLGRDPSTIYREVKRNYSSSCDYLPIYFSK
jgi:IS30 family transposase